VATICASSLAFIDGSVVNVALPAIGAGLQASSAELPWTINAYLLPLSALLLFGGAAGDRYGRRRVLVSGIALFAVASLACALAPNLPVLLVARALQGVGAAFLVPNSLAMLGSAFVGEARGTAIGTWAAAGAIAGAAGPPLGGWLVEVAGWRWIFYVNLPLSIATIVIARRYVAESGADREPLDRAGALLSIAALGALTWALTVWSSREGSMSAAAVAAVVGIVLLGLFIAVEHGRGERALMPTALFGSEAFVGLTIVTFLLYGALGGLFMLLPYLLIVDGHYSPLAAGMALLPFSVVIGVGSQATGWIAGRIGPRWPLTVGPIVTGAGFVVLGRIDPQAGYWAGVLPGLLLVALGMAATAAPLTTAVLASVDDRHSGAASGFNTAIARTGGLIATALAGAVIAGVGGSLTTAFRGAALIAALVAMVAALTAFATLRTLVPGRAGDAGPS
jgi:EmrB/QacA subfamily drug resistance transporter